MVCVNPEVESDNTTFVCDTKWILKLLTFQQYSIMSKPCCMIFNPILYLQKSGKFVLRNAKFTVCEMNGK